MVELQDTLRCLKCGYALRGLPARKCGDCGHVYLRCPECGASQIANEAQNRLLLQMRARAAKLPGRIQGAQITFLVVIGVLWTAIGFIGGAASREIELTGYVVIGATAALSACLVRLLAFRLRHALTAAGSAMTFVMIPFALGEFCAWGNVHVQMAGLMTLAGHVAVGAGIGAGAAGVIGWVILWLFAKDDDRVLLTRAYQGALGDRLLGGADDARPTRKLMYCTHCAGELPALKSSRCGDCGLEQVTCPTCGKHCGVSDALGAMLSIGRMTQPVSAGIWAVVRASMAAIVWLWLAATMDRLLHFSAAQWSWTARGGSVAPIDVMPMLLLVAALTWFVFMRTAVSSALLCMGMVLTAVWFVHQNGYRSVTPWMWVVVLTIGAGAGSLAASLLGWAVRASLPKRRVAMLEAVVPELARQDIPAAISAPAPVGTQTTV